MATRTARTTDQGLGRVGGARSLNGLKHEEIHVSDIDDGQTIATGSKSIVRAAFEPDDSGDDVNVTVLSPTTIGFSVGATSAHSGTLHTWSRGY